MGVWLIQRSGDRHPLYLVCGLLFLGIGVVGAEYGAFLLYLVLSLVCAIQFAYPTALGWAFAFAPVAFVSALWALALVRDLARLALGKPLSVLLDFDDSAIFLLTLALCIGATAWMYRLRPRRLAG